MKNHEKTINPLTTPGQFVVGVNYWALHAGTRMWSDWRPDVVEADLRQLHETGLEVVRVFPLWPDFQPLSALLGGRGSTREYRHGETPLPDTEAGQAGVSETAMRQFAVFLDLLEKYKMKAVIGLITGWMSGRLFVPPAFVNVNVLTNPEAIRWQIRFVRFFVNAFREHPAVLAWDLGNECNCMGAVDNSAQAYLWTASICQAIRSSDPSHPIVSGMHGLSVKGSWTIGDQAELTDVLTVHPYPVFTKYCDQDPVNTLRPILHGTAECRFYADVGGRPGLCEEMGTLGPMLASDAVAADFARSCLWSLWANDCHGLLWWCAYDLDRLEHAPYDWDAVERELGLFRADRTAKPVAAELRKFRDMLRGLPFTALPERRREAVCLLSHSQDHWATAFSSFILAKQAGFDLEFQFVEQPLKDAELYLLPCLTSHTIISRRRLAVLLEKVNQGATLYLSLGSGLPSGFEPLVGLRPVVRECRRQPAEITVSADGNKFTLPLAGKFRGSYEVTRAHVLGHEADGNPAFCVAEYGKGRVYFLGLPLELWLAETPGVFHGPAGSPCWRIYHMVSEAVRSQRVVQKQSPCLVVTEHPVNNDERIVVAINHSSEAIRENLQVMGGWSLKAMDSTGVNQTEEGKTFLFDPHNGRIFKLYRKKN